MQYSMIIAVRDVPRPFWKLQKIFTNPNLVFYDVSSYPQTSGHRILYMYC
jgi:hypothetical protein